MHTSFFNEPLSEYKTWGQMYLQGWVCQGFDSGAMDSYVIFIIRLKQHCLNLGIIIIIAAKT